MAFGHGGNLRELARRAGRDRDDILDFSASINPLGPPDCLRAVLARNIERLVHYPDPDCTELAELLARRFEVASEQVVVGNGSTEIFFALARACRFDRAIVPVPSYLDYAAAVRVAGHQVRQVPLKESEGFAVDWAVLDSRLAGKHLVLLGQPNNPTGRTFDREALLATASRRPDATFVVDEAFADFVAGYRSLAFSGNALPNVIVVRSLTKFYAIPGLRLGFAVASPAVAGWIREQIPPWSVNVLAQEAAVALLADDDYARRTIELVDRERRWLTERLAAIPGLHVYPSEANFLLVRLDRADLGAPELAELLLREAIAIRTFGPGQHLDERFFRVAVRTREENERLCDALAVAMGTSRVVSIEADGTRRVPATGDCPDVRGGAPCAAWSRENGTVPLRRANQRARALMIQGTSSNAGKSILTAALCRILLQDGVRVAPFKAQNMSLNSFVTRDGGEMGRAQVVQAQACRLEPRVEMNPVLLKPSSDTGCQVIVRGRPIGNKRVHEYVRYKPEAFAVVRECYDALAAEFDAIVLEGAGSPGEVNLKDHDIVNMRMARYAEAPVLIAGDIDRGGVFAAFVGTMEVLAPWERALVAGWIVNRFRGDAALLGPALDYTLRHTGRPVLGVVPYLPALNLPQEDSVEFKSGALDQIASNGQAVEIAVIDLPHISNFTDFDAFGAEGDVRVRIVRSAGELGRPDAVVIPGSKNTLADLEYLRRAGLADRIAAIAREGSAEIVGICGGFQMLGGQIRDPLAIESSAAGALGLGLLAVSTVMAAEKTLVRTTARHVPSGLDVTGYEIHHGRTDAGSCGPMFTGADGRVVGVAGDDGRVWGTYLHGVFDADPFRRWFLDRLRVRRGLEPLGEVVGHYDIEPALDRLAETVRASLRMNDIYRLLKLR